MPDLTPEEEPVLRCSHCDNAEDDCECILCEECGEYVEDGCECTVCNHCADRFMSNQRGSCSDCGFCRSCIERGHVDHYSCSNCGECNREDDRSCSNCGRYECCVAFECRRNDCDRCTSCCQCSDSSEYIKEYSCRDYPNAKPSPRTVPKNFLYLGVECETEADEEDELDSIAQDIHEKHHDEILMKEDGSLEHGIELVTGRYSLEAQKELWPRLCATSIKAGLRSWKHSSTGLHVHMSRAFFSPLDIGKILVFINSPSADIRQHIRKIAGRSANNYSQISTKKLTDYNLSDDRYEAVNLTNHSTIEIRIFKGTLNANHVLANIEFCHAIANWVKQVSIQDIENWSNFWNYTMKHKRLYKELINFLEPEQTRLVEASEDCLNRETVAA